MSEVAVSVRPAIYTDFDTVAAMMEQFFAQHHRWHPNWLRPALIGFTQAIFQSWLEAEEELHAVAEIEGRTVGYVRASRWAGDGGDIAFPRRSVHVMCLVVVPDHLRKGAGRALFHAVEQWATAWNAHHISLNVSPKNEVAKAFYEALGYCLENEYRSKSLRQTTYMS